MVGLGKKLSPPLNRKNIAPAIPKKEANESKESKRESKKDSKKK